MQEQIKHTWNIVTVRPNTSKPNVENLLISLPLLAVQRKIADEVKRRVSEAIDLQVKSNELAEEAKRRAESLILNKA